MRSRIAGTGALFTAAALGETSWLTALAALASATGSARGQLIGIGGPSAIPFNWVNDIPDSAFEEFVAIDGGSPEVSPRVGASRLARPGEIVGDQEYAALSGANGHDVYTDYCARWDMPFGCQTTLIQRPDLLIGLALLRTESDGATTEDQMAIFGEIAPSVEVAVRLGIALEGQGTRLLTGALEQMSMAAILFDGAGRVQAMTPAADALLAINGSLDVRDGQLTARTDPDTHLIEGLLSKLLVIENQTAEARRGSVLVGRDDPAGEALIVEGHALARREWTFGFMPQAIMMLKPASISKSQEPTLSARERECLSLLAAGLRPDAIADRLHVAKVTVDMHLSNARRRLGANTMIEAVARAVQTQQITLS
jgi:DNA-binding CsgD family transcriptional regulator